MKKRGPRFLVWWWMHTLALALLAATPWAAAQQGALAPPAPTGLLVDQAGLLDADTHAAIEKRLQVLAATGKVQAAMLIASGTGNEPLADYSLRVAQAWGLGRSKVDNGLLIVLVPSRRAARIEVGYGLEGPIPDVLAARWLEELMPALTDAALAPALGRLLDRVEAALPADKPAPEPRPASADNYLFPDHPEWRLPFVLLVFSPFAIFPMFAARWGAWVSAPLLAGMLGGAAWALWDSRTAGLVVGALALPLPPAWALNAAASPALAHWQRIAKGVANACGVALFFGIVTLFVGVGLAVAGDGFVWAAPVFGGTLALGLAVFLFPGRPAQLMMVVLRSVMHFIFMLVVAWVALAPFVSEPLRLALASATLITGLVALGLAADSRERAGTAGLRRWSPWLFGLAALLALPLCLLALLLAAGGDDMRMRLVQAAVGSGSVAAVLALAAKVGLITAVRVGVGGLFGGGGAQRGG